MARYRGTHTSETYTTGDEGRRSPRTRWRKSVAGTALAAAAMAALTASQAPGAQLATPGGEDAKGSRGDNAQPDRGPGDDSYHTELPPLESPAPPKSPDKPAEVGTHSGIPKTVLDAYRKAERSLATSDRGCHLRWELLAAIGKVESGQARGGAVDSNGTTLKPILGPVLDGTRFARIEDTDGGRHDGDARFDRAVGPMQFIPSTWARWGSDGNGDGVDDPNNIYDAALSAGQYLCAGGKDLGSKAGLDRAILSYNHSRAYLRTVLAWYEYYRDGTHEIPDGKGPLPTTPGAGAGEGSGSGADSGKGAGKDKGRQDGKNDGKEDGKGDGGKDSGKPGDDGKGDSGSESPAPARPAVLQPVGETVLSAGAGTDFGKRPGVKVLDAAAKPVKGAEVRFEIDGDTGASFEGDATVVTGADGTAAAPALKAGDATGRFTVRATVEGVPVPAVFTATVDPRADRLVRTAGSLTAGKDSRFDGHVEVKATYKGKAAADVPMTATLLTADGRPLKAGPHFKGLLGEPVRSLTDVKTGRSGLLGLLSKEGVLKLPAIHTDGTTGTFLLRITTPDGPVLDTKLNVTG